MLKPEPMCFLIADISGYTSYLARVELDHAQDILADLVGTVVTSLRPNFRLAKLEGDAAFTFAPTDKLDGSLLLDTIERCYFGFRRRRRDVRQATSCECNACLRIPDLNLKFVVHHGIAVRQKMAGREELVGADVIIVHRLLKNSVVEGTGIPAYALFSQKCIDAMSIDPEALGMRPHVETYEHVGEVPGWIHDLEKRWQEEEERRRVIVSASEAAYTSQTHTKAPPQIVWEFMTTPGRRTAWQSGVTDFIVEAKGNRRGVGAINHCVHGKDAVIEEILDWRPYDYVTDRSTMNTPGGPVKFLATFELEPAADGTIIHTRFAAPETARERAIMEQLAPMFAEILKESDRNLTEQLDAELAARMAGRAQEPDLPAPKADGLFSEMQPLAPAG
ncbi:MAG: DUF2652 domain-containing protein [Candidatus Limnocylindrales bacterium]|nr:DUF2652 domain-containing protein [Candidatus Limnocylindrales bacterium]